MKRRVLSLMLILVMVACMLPISALAVTKHSTSDACIEVIKSFEGFAKYPYEDNGQYSVGYGTRCPEEDLERYTNEGITEEEATALLQEFISSFENYVNNFASKYSLELTQHQFDALLSFTYNVGNGWMSDTGAVFTQAVINQATGNEFLFAMTMWCMSGGKISSHHIDRRQCEANMYLNGVYSNTPPASYSHVLFDHQESFYDGEVRTIRIQGYDSNNPTEIYPVAVKDGYRFLGWYTAAEGGAWVTMLDASTDTMRLYPHWQEGAGDTTNGTAARYQRTINEDVKVYAKPSTGASVVYTLSAGTTVTVVADYVTADAEKWGKLEDGNWLPLGSTGAPGYGGDENVPAPDPDPAPTPDPVPDEVIATGTVNTDSLNIRAGAGTDYAIVGSLTRGTRVEIYEIVAASGGTRWGRIAKGWISMDYVNLDEEEPADQVIATGTIKTSSGNLNVRSGPGSSYSVVTTLSSGTRVDIYEFTTVSGTKWGRIDQGWISMDYVVLDVVLEAPVITSCYSKVQTAVKVTWTPVEGADGYELYRTTTPEDHSTWVRTKTIHDGEAFCYTNQSLTEGVTYYYCIRAFSGDAENRVYSDFSNVDYMPAAVVFDAPYSNATTSIRLRWNEVAGAHGYQIWRMDDAGNWVIIKTLGDRGSVLTNNQGGTTHYTSNGLKAGKTYTYKIRAFMITDDGRKIFGTFSDTYAVAVMPESTVMTATSPKAGRAQISWNAVSGAAGYQVWMAEGNGAYKIAKSVTDGATAATLYGLSSGTKYSFKVRAYTEVDGKMTFGAYSSAVSVAIQ